MSCPQNPEEDMQKQQYDQEQEEDMDVEDTVVSPLLKSNFKADGAFSGVPYEIVEIILNNIDPVSQLCFSLTTSRFHNMLKTFRGRRSYHEYLHDYWCRPRLSLELSTRASMCGKYIWDQDDYDLGNVPDFHDTEVQWYPCLANLLWDEPFLWSSGGQWCDRCYRVLPPTSWDLCGFERKFWDSALPRQDQITNLLARSLVGRLKRNQAFHHEEDADVLMQELIESDSSSDYASHRDDFDYDLCVKCRLKDIITDNGRRAQVWQGSWQEFENTGREANAVAIYGGSGGKHDLHRVLSFEGWPDSSKKAVSWQDVWRECGLYVKEYERILLPALEGEHQPAATPELRIEMDKQNDFWETSVLTS
ncbi:hypothetical protein DSL72_002758 [Monilinia vaccinii-corymbosi]|uniref:F-box domain-containing protein n=1 Tax=Monilinia vaccinii-corymbosi TaxID=61207 RepID=A0A8A3PDB7_9HELO|nr:hypothetical protein DSL72_002758 [Monilinia vaccinii-corymbosi]